MYKIYRLYDIETDLSYYGSTSMSMNVRLQCHEGSYKLFENGEKLHIGVVGRLLNHLIMLLK